MLVTWPQLFALNKDQIKYPDLIFPGQVLKLPDGNTYTVVNRDTLSGIAQRVNQSNANLPAEISAAGQTAEQKVVDGTPVVTAGAGTNIDTQQATPLNSAETAKLENPAPVSTEVQNSAPSPSPNASEAKSVEEQKIGMPANAPSIKGGIGGGSSTGSDGSGAKQTAANQTIPAAAMTNILHDFTGYTYKITLYLLTSEELNAIVSNPSTFVPTWTLISSGGGNAFPAGEQKIFEDGYGGEFVDTPGRHPDFMEDFYFDKLSMTTVVGLNGRSKASNAIDIKFDITEPYGMSLLDRLLSACYTTAKCSNYVDQPYLLQIDFLSNTDEANQNGIKGTLIDSKRIPIKLIEFKIKPSSGGTRYSVRAIPFNHVAFLQSVGTVPVNISVEANTVGTFFDNAALIGQVVDPDAIKNEERLDAALAKLDQTVAVPFLGAQSVTEQIEIRKQQLRAQFLYQSKSFPTGYNTYYKNISQAKNGQGAIFDFPPYQIAFNIHPTIALSKIIQADSLSSDKVPLISKTDSIRNTTAQGTDPVFKNQSVTNVLAGTSIINVIDRVVCASEYIKKQVRDANAEAEQDAQLDTNTAEGGARATNAGDKKKTARITKPTDWYKVIPSVTIGNFDNKRKSYSKVIIYSIMPYNAANAYHPDFAFTTAKSAQCVRAYNYFYTGKNQDIINLDIDFDATFVTGISTYLNQAARGGSDDKSASPKLEGVEPDGSRPPSSFPNATTAIPIDAQFSGGNASRTAENFAVAGVARSLYSSYPRGDMLNIKLKIVGDPAFIKQDDIYNNPVQTNYASAIQTKTSNNSSPPINATTRQIVFDTEQVYVQLIVKGAIDIDDETGIVNKSVKLSNGQVTNGTFSGIYRVLTVENNFDNGKFEQILDLIKMPDELTDVEVGLKGTTSTPSIKTEEPSANAPTEPATTPLPNILAYPPVGADVAKGPATNPVPSSTGNGGAAATAPTNSAPSNINETSSSVLPQESTKPSDSQLALRSTQEKRDLFTALQTKVTAYFSDWDVRYGALANAPDAKTNVANIQARIELRNEQIKQVQEFGLNQLAPLYFSTAQIVPQLLSTKKLLDEQKTLLDSLDTTKKSTESSIETLNKRLAEAQATN